MSKSVIKHWILFLLLLGFYLYIVFYFKLKYLILISLNIIRIIPYIEVSGCLSVWFSYTVKILIGLGKVYSFLQEINHFPFLEIIKFIRLTKLPFSFPQVPIDASWGVAASV